jgi:hypothetical protein
LNSNETGGPVTPAATAVTAPASPSSPVMYVFLLLYNLLVSWKWPLCIIICTAIAVPALAGKTTQATVSVLIQLVTSKIGEKESVPWAGTTLCFVWALLERYFRRRKTAYLAQRNRDLELRLDPIRSSSNLASTGDSRKGDIWKR